MAVSSTSVPKRPNVILFNPDEMRAESLACYGHPVVSTPNFDALAAKGTRFHQAHTAHTVCTQSRTSFMTGWYTHVRGKRTLWNLLDKDEPNMLKSFKAAGYKVMWWGKNDLLSQPAFPESVTSATSKGQLEGRPPPFPREDMRYFSFLYDAEGSDLEATGDFKNVQAAIDFIDSPEAKDGSPWVVYLPLFKPHPPYSCPEPFHSMYDPSSLPELRPRGTNKPDFHQAIRHYRNLDLIGGGHDTKEHDDFMRSVNAVYLGCISYSDWCFGQLMKALEASGQADNTIVVVFSDHGDWAGDYGLVEKWPSGLDDVLTRVPLIVHAPTCPGGHVVQELVQLFDIVPTLTELCGLGANPVARYVQFGQSLVPMLTGGPGDPERVVFAEGGFGTHEPDSFEGRELPVDHPYWGNHMMLGKNSIYYPKGRQQQDIPLSVCRATMVRTLTHKLVMRSDVLDEDHCSELYDYTSDPRELHNIYGNPKYAAVQSKLQMKLLRWYVQTSDVVKQTEDPRQLPDKLPDIEKARAIRRARIQEKEAAAASSKL